MAELAPSIQGKQAVDWGMRFDIKDMEQYGNIM